MSTGAWILLAAVAAALAFGGWRAAGDGRFHGTRRIRGPAAGPDGAEPRRTSVLADTPWADRLGERATLLQFSSAFCAPCRATRRILEDVATLVPGVAHVEVDAEDHLDLVRRLGVLRTPTTLVLDDAGAEVTRASGAPTRPQVLAALALTGEAT
jgi:thiol-disulfide isomerase/thioredoxin